MKKRFLSLLTALALCLSVAAPALAVGETSVKADNGWDNFSGTFRFSAGVTGTEIRTDDFDPEYSETIYLLPAGTVITFADANGDTGMKGWYKKNGSEQYFDSVTSFTLPAGDACVGGAYKDSPYIFVRGVSGATEPTKPTEPTEPAPPQSKNPFTDVVSGAYFYDSVLWAVERGITAGTTPTTFSPNQTCTRGQIISFLWRAKDSAEPANGGYFSDVAANAYYAKATAWAYEQGMADGAAFAPNDPCTRAMAVEFMWKMAGSPKAAAASFTDVPANAAYADAVAWAVEQGVTAGTSATTFSPDQTCTRAQIVSFLYRDLAK